MKETFYQLDTESIIAFTCIGIAICVIIFFTQWIKILSKPKPKPMKTTDFQKIRIDALEKELQKAHREIQEKDDLVRYYEDYISQSEPATPCLEKPHLKYPACFEPFSGQKLS